MSAAEIPSLDESPDIAWLSGTLNQTQLDLLFPLSNYQSGPYILLEYPFPPEMAAQILGIKYTSLYANVVSGPSALLATLGAKEDRMKLLVEEAARGNMRFQIWDDQHLLTPLLATNPMDPVVLAFLKTERTYRRFYLVESFQVEGGIRNFRVWLVNTRNEKNELLHPSGTSLLCHPDTSPDGVLSKFLPIVEGE